MSVHILPPVVKSDKKYVITDYDAKMIGEIKNKVGKVAAVRVLRWLCQGISLTEAIEFVNNYDAI